MICYSIIIIIRNIISVKFISIILYFNINELRQYESDQQITDFTEQGYWKHITYTTGIIIIRVGYRIVLLKLIKLNYHWRMNKILSLIGVLVVMVTINTVSCHPNNPYNDEMMQPQTESEMIQPEMNYYEGQT